MDACPWFGPDAQLENLADDITDDVDGSGADLVVLPTGAALNAQALDDFLRARPTRMIAIAGDRDSGKTTLICAIYEEFLKGQVPKWLFCGSRTLVAFEERTHDSRAASGRLAPATPHTSHAEGLHFFHLRLRSVSGPTNPRIELMLSDRAGEVYASVRDKPANSTQLLEVIRAERVAILLDGGRVSDREGRANAMQSVRKLLRALIDGGALTSRSHVQIILTKKDVVERADDSSVLKSKIEEFFNLLTRDFASKLAHLTFFEIAARDPENSIESGLPDLLTDWLRVERPQLRRTPVSGIRTSEFDLLLDRAGLGYLP